VGDGSSRSQAGDAMGLVSRREPLEAFTAVRFEGSAGCEVACSSAADDGLFLFPDKSGSKEEEEFIKTTDRSPSHRSDPPQ
jgi:hypothetical protein